MPEPALLEDYNDDEDGGVDRIDGNDGMPLPLKGFRGHKTQRTQVENTNGEQENFIAFHFYFSSSHIISGLNDYQFLSKC